MTLIKFNLYDKMEFQKIIETCSYLSGTIIYVKEKNIIKSIKQFHQNSYNHR
jgi:hypothetical protein